MKRKIRVDIEYDRTSDCQQVIARAATEDYVYLGYGETAKEAKKQAIARIKIMKALPKPETIIIEVDDEP